MCKPLKDVSTIWPRSAHPPLLQTQAWLRIPINGLVTLTIVTLSTWWLVPTGAEQTPKTNGTEAKPITQADIDRFSALHRALYYSAVRGTEWLARQQRTDGSFAAGLIPCLNLLLDADHYIRQVQATLALAQAGRVTGNEKWSAQAKQAVLWLLAGTVVDGQDPPGRAPRPPLALLSRLGATGLLLATIHELHQPAADVLDAAEELARWIQRQQQSDGTLRIGELGVAGTLPGDIPEELDPLSYGPGPALWGLARSQRLRPQAWKLEVLRRARPAYNRLLRETLRPNEASSPTLTKPAGFAGTRPILALWLLAAWSEAYAHTRERAFAEYVFEQADAMLPLQYTEGSQPLYLGGFVMSLADKTKHQAPDWQTARFAWALTLAARTARQVGETNRYNRYVLAAEGALQFLSTLQYTALNTTHFAEHYQPKIMGGFRTNLRDGTLRLEVQQAALTALWTFLETISLGEGQ
ncbi:MAG: hypothetical protein RMI91_11680 [Gemmatales bacterium]|nr:hypothetical protein [Gemmatales bacterium]MDW7995302.1 hypothetical protein [Gemmatales bacterium]